jgi:hypothetical protein
MYIQLQKTIICKNVKALDFHGNVVDNLLMDVID